MLYAHNAKLYAQKHPSQERCFRFTSLTADQFGGGHRYERHVVLSAVLVDDRVLLAYNEQRLLVTPRIVLALFALHDHLLF